MHLRNSLVPFIALCAVLVLCGRENNPFTDFSNARSLIVESGISDGDTLGLFDTESLVVVSTARELIDSVVVRCDGNRLGASTTVGENGATRHAIAISLFDTGWQTITLITYRKNSQAIQSAISIFGRLPLNQEPVIALAGQPITFRTSAVRDNDVLYHWDIGSGVVLQSLKPETVLTALPVALSVTGRLWCTDLFNRFASPVDSFTLRVTDTSRPIITCINENYNGGDTLVTGDTSLYLRLHISDYGRAHVYAATANDSLFDIAADPLYIKQIHGLAFAAGAVKVKISAIDDQVFGNTALRTFYVIHADSAAAQQNRPAITVSFPPVSPYATGSLQVPVAGSIIDYTRDSVSMIVKLFVNGVLQPDSSVATGHFGAAYGLMAMLSDSVNTVRVAAWFSDGTSIAAETTITVIRRPIANDSIGPYMAKISIDTKNADGLHTSVDTILLSVMAFDESGIVAVRVNGSLMPPAGNFVYERRVALTHNPFGDSLLINAVDSAGNDHDTTIMVFYNHGPLIVKRPAAVVIPAESRYADTIRAVDADGDQVSFVKTSGPNGLVVSLSGVVTWQTTLADTGTHGVTVSVSDGIDINPLNFTLTVIDTVTPSLRVAFLTTVDSFPATLQATLDTLRVVARVRPGTGRRPFIVTATVGETGKNIISDDSVLLWRPQLTDTGWQRIDCTVRDALNRADTLHAMVQVVVPNRPFILSSRFTGDTVSAGVLDMNAAIQPETLSITIIDPDNPTIEEHTVSILRGGVETVSAATGGMVRVIINPVLLPVVQDTLVITVADRGGHLLQLSRLIYYGYSETPIDSTTIWRYARTVTINTAAGGAGVAQTLTRVPVLVRLGASFPFAQAQAQGRDIRFVKNDSTPLPYEIERWDSAGLQAAVWVLLDTVYGNQRQTIHMRWGNRFASDSSAAKTVFDTANGFAGVWHMTPTSLVAPQLRDATSSGGHASMYGMGTATVVTGIAGNALNFNGASQYVDAGNGTALSPAAQITVSAWVRMDNGSLVLNSFSPIVAKGNSSYHLQVNNLADVIEGSIYDGLGTRWHTAAADSQYRINNWYFAAMTYDGAVVRLYIDGAVQRTVAGAAALVPNTFPVWFGRDAERTNRFFRGALDEVTIARSARSAAWIKFAYENQKAGSTVVTIP